jgi:hypothetical protein
MSCTAGVIPGNGCDQIGGSRGLGCNGDGRRGRFARAPILRLRSLMLVLHRLAVTRVRFCVAQNGPRDSLFYPPRPNTWISPSCLFFGQRAVN